MLPAISRKPSMTPRILLTLVLLSLLGNARGDYSCLCCYEIETPVYPSDNTNSAPLGYMYEFDCKAIYQQNGAAASFQPVQYEKKVGFVLMNSANIIIQTCAGDIPTDDLVTSPPTSQTITSPGSTSSTSATSRPSSSTLLSSLLSTASTTTTGTTVSMSPSKTVYTAVPLTTQTSTRPFPSASSTYSTATSTVASNSTTRTLSTTFPSTSPTSTVATPTVASTSTAPGTRTTLSSTSATSTPAATTTVASTSSSRATSTTASVTTAPATSTTAPTTTTMAPTTSQSTTAPTTQKPHCTDGWLLHQDSCYYIYTHDHKTWDQSNSYCTDRGAHLSIIQSQSENTFIIGQLNRRIDTDDDNDRETAAWIGGTDRDSEGTWVWRDSHTHTDTPINGGYTFWHHGEPDAGDGDHDEDCMCMVGNKNFDWEDYRCSKEMYFVCERSAVPTTTAAPATATIAPYTYGVTIPSNSVKVIAYSTQKPDCHNGWLTYQDSCYLIHSDDRWNWHDANNYCTVHGAHLATLQSQGENSFMVAELRQRISTDHHDDTDTGVWVGATDQDAEGTWVWRDSITHTDIPVSSGFTSWYHNEPDSGDGDHDEDCMCLIGRKGFDWQDHRCDQKMFFACERSVYYDPYSPIIG